MRIAIGSDHAGFALKAAPGRDPGLAGPRGRRPGHRQRGARSTTRRSARRSAGPSWPGEADRGIVLGGSRPGRADRGQQGPRRAGRAVQRPLHGPPVPRAQRRQRPVDGRAHRRPGAGRRDPHAVADHRRSRAAATSGGSPRSPRSSEIERSDRDALAEQRTTTSCFDLIDREVERQNTTLQLIAVGELHLAGGAGGHRLGAHQQVLRGLPGQALLRRQRGHRRGRGPRPRAGQGAVRRRARQRAAPLGRQRQHGRLPRRCSSRATPCWA